MPVKNVNPRIVVIGGGTGSFTILSSLKNQPCELTALVNMADDGGSTGILRDHYGVLPPGDVRQCLVALSDSSQSLRELFNYRFPSETPLAGHSFGNLFLSAVEMMASDFGEAVKLASEVLRVRGRVVPITLDNCHLILETGDEKISGEYLIANTDLREPQPKLALEPRAVINPVARDAIARAKLIVIAPGNLYGSLVPALLVEGVAQALQKTAAKVAYVCNLVNKPVQTRNFSVHDYVAELERFAGEGVIDYVLYNTDKPSKKLLDAYALDGEYPVGIDHEQLQKAHYTAIGGAFLAHTGMERDENDTLILRSLIRHDAEAIARKLIELAHD